MFKASSLMVTDLQATEVSAGLGHPGYVIFGSVPKTGEETKYLDIGQYGSSL